MYIYIYIHIHIYVCIHTHTHIYMRRGVSVEVRGINPLVLKLQVAGCRPSNMGAGDKAWVFCNSSM